MVYDLIVVAGEPSGDEHASHVLKKLHSLNPHLKIAAVCGPHMKEAYPLFEILNIDQLSIMGFIDVLINIPKLFLIYRKLVKFIISNPSKGILFVDYPGMNLKLEKTLRKKGYRGKIWHFIAPTAWAWKKNRTATLNENVDKLFCILPFEEEFFKSHGVNAEYVGNPLVQKIKMHKSNVNRDRNLIAIFPGSRAHEIKKNLPLILEACSIFIKKNPNYRLSISCANPTTTELIELYLKKKSFDFKIDLVSAQNSQNLMQKASIAIAKSGTCNLELGLYQTPTIIVYAISKLDVFIARNLLKIRLPFFSLPNLILNDQVFKELYGPNLTISNLVSELNNLKNDPSKIVEKTKALSQSLGNLNPGELVAKEIYLSL